MFLSNLETSKRVLHSWIAGPKCRVIACHDVSRIPQIQTKTVKLWDWTNKPKLQLKSWRIFGLHALDITTLLALRPLDLVVLTCFRLCCAVNNVKVQDYCDNTSNAHLNPLFQLLQTSIKRFSSPIRRRVWGGAGSRRTVCQARSIFEKALWNTLVYDSQVVRKVQHGHRRWGQ